MFLAPNFFGGSTPEFLKSIYKIRPDSDHVAKFQGDRSRGLGESVAKKKEKKTSAVKHKPVRNGGSGRPNNAANIHWRQHYTIAYITFREIYSLRDKINHLAPLA